MCPFACRMRRLAQNGYPGLGLRHFTCKFSHKIALVTCPFFFATANARAKVWAVVLLCSILPVNSRVTWLFWHMHAAFRERKLAQNGCPGLGLRHFTCKFSWQNGFSMFQWLVKCPSEFRERRQSGCPGLGPRQFTWEFSHKIDFSDMSKCISSAHARAKR